MTTEVASRCEFAQLVSYHVLCYIYRNKLIPVVHGDGLSDEIGRNHACTRPRLDDRLLASLVLFLNYFFLLDTMNLDVVFLGSRVL